MFPTEVCVVGVHSAKFENEKSETQIEHAIQRQSSYTFIKATITQLMNLEVFSYDEKRHNFHDWIKITMFFSNN